MQLSLNDDSEDEHPLDPRKELTEYLESKHEERKEGLVEWWGVSKAHISSLCLTNRSLPYASTIVTIGAQTSQPAYSPVMTTVLRRCHYILVMDSRLSQRSSITCTIVTHS